MIYVCVCVCVCVCEHEWRGLGISAICKLKNDDDGGVHGIFKQNAYMHSHARVILEPNQPA